MIDTEKKDGTTGASVEGKVTETAVDRPDKIAMPTAGKKDVDEPKKKEAEGRLMYVGPTVPGIGIQNRVYTEMPAEAAGQAKEVPEVGLLFIPVKDYPMANKMLREKTGYIYDAYCKAVSLRKGGGKA